MVCPKIYFQMKELGKMFGVFFPLWLVPHSKLFWVVICCALFSPPLLPSESLRQKNVVQLSSELYSS